eukprot:c17816_g1_i1.p1 GENE.c17816_g1_i1~~c17816_g1_i1.p1  ORF type:complete len:340 (-),score=110.23 c17816_g1_i1:25-1044(-)
MKNLLISFYYWFYVVFEVLFTRFWFISYRSKGLPSLISLKGKNCIVTGATSGIGQETAKLLVENGAHVILAVRNTKLANELIANWKKNIPELSAESIYIDLTSLDSVRRFSAEIIERKTPIHYLINNAGFFDIGRKKLEVTKNGHEEHFQVNFLSPLLLEILLLPALEMSSSGARVLNIVSLMHRVAKFDSKDIQQIKNKNFSSTNAYSLSKLSAIAATIELQKRIGINSPIQIFAVDPGIVRTNITRNLANWINEAFTFISKFFALTPSESAECIVSSLVDERIVNQRRKQKRLDLGSHIAYNNITNCNPEAYSTNAIYIWNFACEHLGLSDRWCSKN